MIRKYRPALEPGNPFVAISCGTTHVFRTGVQRSRKPVFSNKTAPCREACPIGIDIAGAVARAADGDLEGAIATWVEENPLPGVCGRVCYFPCERACNRAGLDGPVNIRSFERYLSDHAGSHIPENRQGISRPNRIAVVGSGPAGLSGAYHLARLGYPVTLFEARPETGGMLRYGIPAYRLPRAVLDREIQRVVSRGIEVRTDTTVGRDLGWKEMESFDAVLLASGLQSGKTLFEGCSRQGAVLSGLEFLADPRRWSLEDPARKVLVIGGGNVAVDAARTLVRLRRGRGEGITLVCAEEKEGMPCLPEEIREALEEGISLLDGWAPLALHEKDGEGLRLDLYRADVRRDDRTGKLEILRAGPETRTLLADGIVFAVGQGLENGALPAALSTSGGIISRDAGQRTSLPRIFAAGDAAGAMAYVADAIADGKRAALAIHCDLQGIGFETEFALHGIGAKGGFSMAHFLESPGQQSPELKSVVSGGEINTLFFTPACRREADRQDASRRRLDFREVTGGLNPAAMEEEMARCFRCGTCIDCGNCMDFCPDISVVRDEATGVYGFDADYCKGCGICATACPRHVIEMAGESP